MSEIMILAVCFQLKQLKKQPEKKNIYISHSCLSAVHIYDFHIFIFKFGLVESCECTSSCPLPYTETTSYIVMLLDSICRPHRIPKCITRNLLLLTVFWQVEHLIS